MPEPGIVANATARPPCSVAMVSGDPPDGKPFHRTPEEQPVQPATFKKGTLRAGLVDAATALIAEKGADALSVSELTRRLGVSSAWLSRPTALRGGRVAAGRDAIGTGRSAVAESGGAGWGGQVRSWLRSPAITMFSPSSSSVALS